MSPSTRPKRRSRSSGESTWVPMMLALKVGEFALGVVPAAAAGQARGDVLHEQAGHVAAGRCQRVIERRWYQHLDHRPPRPAVLARVEVGAVEVVDGRADDD